MQHPDHLAMAVADLDAAEAGFRELGFDVIASSIQGGGGGPDPTQIQHLLFIMVGHNQYLEAVPLDWKAPGHGPAPGVGWWTWYLRSDDLDGLNSHLKQLGIPAAGAPAIPPGAEDLVPPLAKEIRVAGLHDADTDKAQPCFIQRPPGLLESFPGYHESEHKKEPDGVAWVTVSGDTEELERWVGEHSDEIRIVPGPPRIVSVAVRLVDGGVVEISNDDIAG